MAPKAPQAPDSGHPARVISESRQFQLVIDELVTETGRTHGDVRRDAIAALEEMNAQIDGRATRAWDQLGRFLTRAYTVDADTTSIPALADLNRKHSLVFLPNHRSYLDPLVLRTALAPYGFEPNHVLGGINLDLWPISSVARRSGLVFIRRSTRNDPVYPAMMRLYFGYLLRQHANLEWYFEGGRTRTGKLRPPKMGVLRYLIDAFVANGADADDVILVPVAIVYDQQHEVAALSYEETGGKKRPESLTQVATFARAQGRRRGRAHIRFGEPLSLRAALDEAIERADTDDSHEVVPRVAFEVAHRINAATPITPAALVTFGLLDNDGRAMTLKETLSILDPLVGYVRRRGLPLTTDVDLGRPMGLRKALTMLVNEGVIDEYDGGDEPVYTIADDRAHEAGFYRNTVTHYFLNRAILEVAVVMATDGPEAPGVPGVWEHALMLRDLLKYEFFFATKAEFDEAITAEAEAALPGWSEKPPSVDELVAEVSSRRLLLAHRVIGPFLEAYAVVADRLALREPAAPLDQESLVMESLGVARQRWLQHDLRSPESISKDLMYGALQLAGNRGLLGPGDESLREQRQAFADELAEVVRAVGIVRTFAQQRLAPTARKD